MSPKLYLNILDAPRRKFFAQLAAFRTVGFLAGGTALALQLGHRYSYDFDIFCDKEISARLIQKIRTTLSHPCALLSTPEEFTFLTPEDIKVTFLYYPFTFPGRLIHINDGLPLLSILNIATSKAYALHQRASFRDYVDMYMVLRRTSLTLERIICNAERVYGDLFSAKLFLGQLIYLEDMVEDEKRSIKYIGPSVAITTIFSFFKKEVHGYQKRHFGL